MRQDGFAQRPALPEGDDLFGVGAAGAGFDAEGCFETGIEDVQILQGVAAQLGVGGGVLWGGTLLADDELALADDDGLVLEQVLEGEGALDGDGGGGAEEGAQFPVEIGEELRPLGGEGFAGVEGLLAQGAHPFGERHGVDSNRKWGEGVVCRRLVSAAWRWAAGSRQRTKKGLSQNGWGTNVDKGECYIIYNGGKEGAGIRFLRGAREQGSELPVVRLSTHKNR